MSKKEGRWKNPKPKTEALTPTPERKMGKREVDCFSNEFAWVSVMKP